MAQKFLRFGSALALAASLSMIAAPAVARDRWHGRHHHRGGIDTGDVIAGVLILGGIAAIASAASNSDNDRDEEYREVDYPEPYDDRPEYVQPSSSYSGGGIDSAVDTCVGQVERGDESVPSVDNASRTGDGWRISGQLGSGGAFSCWIDNDGRIRNVDLGGSAYYEGAGYEEPAGEQWDDETYARARAAQSGEYSEVDEDLASADY